MPEPRDMPGSEKHSQQFVWVQSRGTRHPSQPSQTCFLDPAPDWKESLDLISPAQVMGGYRRSVAAGVCWGPDGSEAFGIVAAGCRGRWKPLEKALVGPRGIRS